MSLRARGPDSPFASRYGPWGLVAGASEGLGAAFVTVLADRGVNLVLVARRPQPLERLGARLPSGYVTVAADLSTTDGVAAACTAAAGLGMISRASRDLTPPADG